jgi:hypothetical protein
MADDSEIKAGRRHSASDAAILRAMRDDSRAHAAKMSDYLRALGYEDEDGDGLVTAADVAATKAEGAPPAEDAPEVVASVKALGDRTLELRVAWGRDGHGEAFSPSTDFDLDNFPAPPVLYYHGYKADGKPAPKPIVIGRTLARESRADGHYITAKLNTRAEADRVLAAAAEGRGYVSPGTAAHLIRKGEGGALLYWPIVEISAWDGAPTRKQAHPQSLAFLKAIYEEAGLPVPSPLTVTPEAAGDAAGAVEIDPETLKQVLAAEVARALTARN